MFGHYLSRLQKVVLVFGVPTVNGAYFDYLLGLQVS